MPDIIDEFTGPALVVYHDGDCPVCAMEVRFYRRIDREQRVAWIDIMGLTAATLPDGKTRDELLGKFHARDSDGWHVGVAAFARIWRELPGFRHVHWVFRLPVIRQCAELAYRGFLAWQRRHREKRVTAGEISPAD